MSNEKSSKTKRIEIEVDLDEKEIPQSIRWGADDQSDDTSVDCRAMILSMWDHNNKDTLRLDLWTHNMTVDEMKIFFHQTLVTMAETLDRSVGDERISGDMKDFCDYFAERMEIKQNG